MDRATGRTVASLSANIAVGGADPIGKALAGWPALSMLASVKLLFSMFDHGADDQRTIVRDDQRTSGTVPDVLDTVPATGRQHSDSSAAVPNQRTEGASRSLPGTAGRPADGSTGAPGASGGTPDNREGASGVNVAGEVDIRTVAHLVSAARTARVTLVKAGRSLSRDNLADAMRNCGHGVSNARASLLLKILKAERDVTAIGQGLVAIVDIDPPAGQERPVASARMQGAVPRDSFTDRGNS